MNQFALKAFAFLAIVGFGVHASATDVAVRGARLDTSGENLLVDVAHGGGCAEHEYKLVMKGCAESFPVQCQATVQDMTFDACESFVHTTAKFNLKDYGINTKYYSEGSLTLTGSRGSSASVRLPNFSAATPRSPSIPVGSVPVQKRIICVTHMNSDLEIMPGQKEATLLPIGAEPKTYGITNVDTLVLESYPSILQTTFSLDDGRQVVIEFKDGERVGTGYFIRTTGDASPRFNTCVMSL